MGIHKQFRKASSWVIIGSILGGLLPFQNSLSQTTIPLTLKIEGHRAYLNFTTPPATPNVFATPPVNIALVTVDDPDSGLAMFGVSSGGTTLPTWGTGSIIDTFFNSAGLVPFNTTNPTRLTGESGLIVCTEDQLSFHIDRTVSMSFDVPIGFDPQTGVVLCGSAMYVFEWHRIDSHDLAGAVMYKIHSDLINSLMRPSSNRGPVMLGLSGNRRVGNRGFVPFGSGLLGVRYDRGTNYSTNQFDGHADRIHLDYVQRFGQFFAGIAGVYRQSKYTLDNNDPWETEYYGPRIDLGWIAEHGGSGKDAINPDYAYIQLSGGYLWGKGKLDGVNGDRGYLIPSSLVVGASKQFKPRLALQPEVNLQWMWQKLGTIGADTFKNRNYGRADFNLGLEALLQRGWFITPNAGYRWDIRAVCTQTTTAGAEKTCVPKASGLRYGVQVGKESTAGSNFINQLALSAYYDYFKKSGVKQTQWGVMAQYPF